MNSSVPYTAISRPSLSKAVPISEAHELVPEKGTRDS